MNRNWWPYFIKGDFDNTQPGRIRAVLMLTGNQVVELELLGNCYRDLAGTTFSIVNPAPLSHENPALVPAFPPRMGGMAGLWTASLKYRRQKEASDAPGGAGLIVQENRLHLEWYTDDNQQNVLESSSFEIAITTPVWVLTIQEEVEQLERNHLALQSWLGARDGAWRGAQLTLEFIQEEAEDPAALQDDEWTPDIVEQFLCADEMSETDTPDEPPLDADDDLGFEIEFLAQDIEPDPKTEGLRWIVDKDGIVRHPLVVRTAEILAEIRQVESGAGTEEEEDEEVRALRYLIESLHRQMNSFLSHVAFDTGFEPSLLASILTRAQVRLNRALDATRRLEITGLLTPSRSERILGMLFGLREELLVLIKELRDQAKSPPGEQA